ncbi:aspartate/glutamate racemase family protein [Enterococcus sp. 669A]|uniref:Aspartate/glutamate racemase family protein n=1 Tax=Candidatus Enterococcus moelleringii TaxID=2815325 RepID=A0ABS3L6E2_9ENTE|nr:aspartate/glutamate racemase family protein [Enterococcus sp. 669A]MBO1305177.1 aspartate/glutamate racemase family protein [Enterococcus sp. 669A]
MDWKGTLNNQQDLQGIHQVPATPFAGYAIGIIAVDLKYPKLPGNVANATTFSFPVLYEVVEFEIEQLFAGAGEIEEQIIAAAKKLESRGVRAIVGACGYFGHFQQVVADTVDIPVFLSSISQIPLIKLSLKKTQKILTLVASGEDITPEFFQQSGADLADCVICEIGSLESFAPIRWGKTKLDNQRLTDDLVATVKQQLAENPAIGAVLLECSDLPPYACAIQQATGLAVFDFITLINWVYTAVVQRPYYGHF